VTLNQDLVDGPFPNAVCMPPPGEFPADGGEGAIGRKSAQNISGCRKQRSHRLQMGIGRIDFLRMLS
jgi:hypothetical protein